MSLANAAMKAVQAFPNLSKESFSIASPEDKKYNCIAWAAGDDRRFWWPAPSQIAFWPSGFPRAVTVENFIQIFPGIVYIECPDGLLENGFEKLVLYTKNGVPTHMAKQRPDGHWWSKLGGWHDI